MKSIIFDCDGVLVNSESLVGEAEIAFLATFGMNYTMHDWEYKFSGITYANYLAQLQSDYTKMTGQSLPPDFEERQQAAYMNLLTQKLKAFDGVQDLLAALTRAQVPFCVASNSLMPKLLHKLNASKLTDYFGDRIYSAEEVEHPKPAPDIYLMAMKRLGVTDPSSVIVIEDSATGVRAGVAAGAQVIGFTSGSSDPLSKDFTLRAVGAVDTASSMQEVKEKVFARLGIAIPPVLATSPAVKINKPQ